MQYNFSTLVPILQAANDEPSERQEKKKVNVHMLVVGREL